jgi:hypothetical protein
MKLRVVLPFILFPAIIYFLSFYGTPLTLYTSAYIVGGFLLAGLAEYFIHRVAFHNRRIPRKLKKLISHGHVYHHRYPQRTDDLILPIGIILPVSLILLCLFISVFGTPYMFWFYSGVMSSYFLYEAVHYSYHHFTINLPYFRQMQAYHLSHHNDSPNSKFMITNPLWDWIFGTYR